MIQVLILYYPRINTKGMDTLGDDERGIGQGTRTIDRMLPRVNVE
jgi:hypothetical protein